MIEFWADDSAAQSLALLLDVSGSMRVGSKMADARSTANMLLGPQRSAPAIQRSMKSSSNGSARWAILTNPPSEVDRRTSCSLVL